MPDGVRGGFVSTEPGQPEYPLNVANANGTGTQTQLAPGAYRIGSPVWSPDGSKIANEVDYSFHYPRVQIEVRSANGTILGEVPFTPPGFGDFGWNLMPKWSPDSTKIAFSASTFIVYPTQENHIPQGGIFVAEAGNLTQVATLSDNSTDTGHVWSPDGLKIIFSSDRDGNSEIYSVNANGTSLTRLTNNAAADINPDWSHQPKT